jgi:sugar lactone lactonase YvrE
VTESFSLVLSVSCRLGESPVWRDHDQSLLFVDITGRTIHHYLPVGGRHHSVTVDEDIGCIAPALGGGLIAGMRSGLWLLSDDGVKRKLLAANPEDQTVSRFNDGCVDPLGRYWAGTVDEPKAGGKAHLYRYDRRGLVAIEGGLLTSNGLAFSPDGSTLYHSDTPRFLVYRYDYDVESGIAVNRRVFTQIDRAVSGPGRPDGAAVDEDGCYWSALYEGARVHRYDPDGRLMESFPLPALKPTMVAFGGADRKTLFVTTARDGEVGGDLYAMAVETAGLALMSFDPQR